MCYLNVEKKVIGIISLGTAIYSGAYLICQYKYMVFFKNKHLFCTINVQKRCLFCIKGQKGAKVIAQYHDE